MNDTTVDDIDLMAERRWSPRRRDRPDLTNKLNSPTAVHHVVRASGHDDRCEPSPHCANVADRNRQGKSSVPICGRHVRRRIVLYRTRTQQRGTRTPTRSTGVGLSSSAESTAHQSNRDIKCESLETEV